MDDQPQFVFMTPAKLEELSLDLWGDKWREAFCEFFDITYSQLHRYMTVYKGQTIPKRIAVSLDMLRTLKSNEIPFPTGEEYKAPFADAQPVKFVQVPRPKVPRNANDAPEIDLFGDDETEEEIETETEAAPEPPAPEPEPEPTKTETKPKPNRNGTAKKPEPKATGKKAPAKAPAKPKKAPPKPKAA